MQLNVATSKWFCTRNGGYASFFSFNKRIAETRLSFSNGRYMIRSRGVSPPRTRRDASISHRIEENITGDPTRYGRVGEVPVRKRPGGGGGGWDRKIEIQNTKTNIVAVRDDCRGTVVGCWHVDVLERARTSVHTYEHVVQTCAPSARPCCAHCATRYCCVRRPRAKKTRQYAEKRVGGRAHPLSKTRGRRASVSLRTPTTRARSHTHISLDRCNRAIVRARGVSVRGVRAVHETEYNIIVV